MSRKPYQAPDHDLWVEVARTLKPLGKRARKETESPKPAVKTMPKPTPAGEPRPPAAVARLERSGPPPLSGFDRRTSQRFIRGQVEIDARLDLHGTGIEMARHRLFGFLSQSRGAGHRLVLVITGKGASPFARHTLHGAEHFHTPEREGRLRRHLTEWLHEPEFRALVSGFQPAHPKHGGGGAFYVKLRRIRP
jgi:DNA-nicking Smr family endonuclease